MLTELYERRYCKHLFYSKVANANGNQVQDEHRQKVKEKSTGGKANVRKGGATGLQGEAKEEDGIGAATVATHTGMHRELISDK